MKTKYFSRLAWSGIKNNRNLYIPYILSSAGIVAVYYIMVFLSSSPVLNGMFGARTSIYLLQLGSYVLLIFAVLFILYINTILVNCRLKEFGLYNVLGMNKRSLSSIWAYESIMSSGISIVIGLVIGIAFSKLSELIFSKMIHTEIGFSFTFSAAALVQTFLWFLLLFFIVFLRSIIIIKRSDPLDLMKSESVGEKPPRASWMLSLLGIIFLSIAYFLAISIKKPITVLPIFFLAAGMVVVAIYFIFTSVSVLLCKILKNNKKYYYKSAHFISISSMAYRMKRNGMGLASICILSTMVMVMLTGSGSLYFGQQNSLDRAYPQSNIFTIESEDLESSQQDIISGTETTFNRVFEENNAVPTEQTQYRYTTIVGDFNGSTFLVDYSADANKFDANAQIAFIPLSDYNEISNTAVALKEDEVLLYPQYAAYNENELFVENTKFTISEKIDTFFDCINFSQNGISTPIFVIEDEAYSLLNENLSKTTNNAVSSGWCFGYNLDKSVEEQVAILEQVCSEVLNTFTNSVSVYFGNKVSAEKDFADLFGGLLFFGALFSIVFICATILIIYYKQLSEGYEDKARFAIMQKVGMTKKEIRKSINSQMITIFLLPVVLAALNLAVAIPMIYRLSTLFAFYNMQLIIAVACIICTIFIILYAVVYKITSNVYFNLVSEGISK